MALKLYNTKTRTVEEIQPLVSGKIGMYTCGMTVYDYSHIGHGRKYTMDDILRRTLAVTGFKVTHVQNVTDVGHLTGENEGDADTGEDKMEKGAKKAGKTVWEVAQFFTDDFYRSMDQIGILRPTIVAKATEHIPAQIALVERLIAKGIAYDTPEAVYYDVTKFPAYGELSGQKLSEKKVAVREEVETGSFKKNPQDFSLWFKRVGHFTDHVMHWPSPWGDGFPGWHIECSAMAMQYLGETLDIHTGGIDHIPVHHENEIAQSEGATGKPFVHYWVHYYFLTVNGEKMSKSLGNYVRIQDVIDKGYDPLALRYLYLGAHFRSSLNFTWEALDGAATSLKRLRTHFKKAQTGIEPDVSYKKQLLEHIENDLDTPGVLAILWSLARDTEIDPEVKNATGAWIDQILGLDISKEETVTVSEALQKLLDERATARAEKNWKRSDEIRDLIAQQGFVVKDTDTGQMLERNN